MAKNEDAWAISPITGKQQVLCESNDTNGETRMDLSSGFFTNEYPMSYKKHPDFDIEILEEKMPKLMKALRFDDKELGQYWYPSSVQTPEGVVFPIGGDVNWSWCYAPIVTLSEDEKEKYSSDTNYTSKIDMDSAEYFDRYLDAIKKIKGYSLGELPE